MYLVYHCAVYTHLFTFSDQVKEAEQVMGIQCSKNQDDYIYIQYMMWMPYDLF